MPTTQASFQLTPEQSQDASLFAEAVGFVHGLKGISLDYDVFDTIFAARFRSIPASWYEIAYQKGHQLGGERIKYAVEHGARRAPGIPGSILEEFVGLRESHLKAIGIDRL